MPQQIHVRYLIASAGLFALSCAAHAAEQVASHSKSNVIFVFSDDQHFDALAITGDPITQKDPKEQHNLANNPEYAGILENYRKRCQQQAIELAK